MKSSKYLPLFINGGQALIGKIKINDDNTFSGILSPEYANLIKSELDTFSVDFVATGKKINDSLTQEELNEKLRNL